MRNIKNNFIPVVILAVVVGSGLVMSLSTFKQTEKVFAAGTTKGQFHPKGKPLSTNELSQRMIERRVVEAVIWGMPAVNYDRMYEAAVAVGSGNNQIVYWSRPISWKNQTLTPNPNTIYLMPFIDTKNVGPMVMEIPPAEGGAIVGSLMDIWQMPIEDVGIAGVDKGKGGKYLILPPNYEGNVPVGYIAMPSLTYQTYGLLRSNIADDSDAGIAKSVEYAKQIKLYPLSQAADAPTTKFVDAIDELYDATIPYDLRFFESLNRIVQTEPWLERDKAMIDTLRSLGIEKGKPFRPDEQTKQILNDSMAEARAWIDAQYVAGYAHDAYYEGSHWALPVYPAFYPEAQVGYTNPDSYSVDARGVTYSFIFFAPKHLGEGQFYFFVIHDNRGNDLEGSNTYRLRVPANAPVRQYWSVVGYDRETHALIRDVPRSSRASNMPEVKQNADGSVDIWFAPEAPEGKESNWIPTKADGQFELVFRFYGPEKPLFDKTWVLPDLERVAVSMADRPTADEVFAAIDTSDWKVRPEDYGFTVQEYLHAEHDLFMSVFLRRGADNKFFHFTELTDMNDRWAVSPSLDHLYSIAIVDSRQGFSITLPDVGDRFMSLHLQDANHGFPLYDFEAGGKTHHFKAEDFDTPFLAIGVRTGTDSTPEDVKYIVEVLQPQYKIEAGSNDFSSVRAPDVEKVLKLRNALVIEYDKLPDTYGTVSYDIREVTDWEKTVYTIAGAWGLSPEDTAMYPAYALPGAKGNQCYEATYPAIPAREFFSITVYGQDKYLMSNEYNVVSSRRPNFKANPDGSFTVKFGGMECKKIADARGVNFLYTPKDNWGFLMRNYAPDVEAMKRYKMPEIKPVQK